MRKGTRIIKGIICTTVVKARGSGSSPVTLASVTVGIPTEPKAVGKALEFVVLALDGVRDCKACGSEVVATWLDPVEMRLIYAKNYLSDAIREGGEL